MRKEQLTASYSSLSLTVLLLGLIPYNSAIDETEVVVIPSGQEGETWSYELTRLWKTTFTNKWLEALFGEGLYSGLNGVFSPFNWACEAPPKIFKDSVFVAYLTENENITPRVSTEELEVLE